MGRRLTALIAATVLGAGAGLGVAACGGDDETTTVLEDAASTIQDQLSTLTEATSTTTSGTSRTTTTTDTTITVPTTTGNGGGTGGVSP